MTRRQILLALLPPLFFGTGFTIAKPAVTHFPPLFMMLIVYGGIAVGSVVGARLLAWQGLPVLGIAAGITAGLALIHLLVSERIARRPATSAAP